MFIPLGNKACNKPAAIDAYAFQQLSLSFCFFEVLYKQRSPSQPTPLIRQVPHVGRTCKIHCKRRVFLCASSLFFSAFVSKFCMLQSTAKEGFILCTSSLFPLLLFLKFSKSTVKEVFFPLYLYSFSSLCFGGKKVITDEFKRDWPLSTTACYIVAKRKRYTTWLLWWKEKD